MGKFKINFFKSKKELFEYEKYQRKIDELQYFKDYTIGLWATDRPDLIQDPENVMFQINDNQIKNKYYLKSVKLIDNPSEGRLYYECEYSNGISTKIEYHNFKENLIINVELWENSK